MKVLIDTNVILDVLCNRKGLAEDSKKVWKLCEVKKIEGVISALSVPNIVYILRKELTPKKTKNVLSELSLIFDVADLKSDDLLKAAELQFSDYEDALQSTCAKRIKAEYIITNNIKDFLSSKVPAIKPAHFLEGYEVQ